MSLFINKTVSNLNKAEMKKNHYNSTQYKIPIKFSLSENLILHMPQHYS